MAELIINGAAPTALYVGSAPASAVYLGNVKVWEAGVPAKTMRFDFKYDHFDPTTGLADLSADGLTWTHVADDVYDFHYDDADWGEHTTDIGTGGLFNLYAYKSGSTTVWPMSQHQFDILDMNLAGVTTVSYLFNSARQVQNIYAIRNTSSVTNFRYFIGHSSRNFAITSIPLFDTSSATDMSHMFHGCNSLTSVPLFNTGNATTTGAMLYGCSSLTSVPQFNTGNVTDISSMLLGCNSLTTVPLFNTSNVTTINGLFSGCGALTTVPLLDTGNATNMNNMFYNCSALTSVPLFNTGSATTMSEMFRGCSSLTSIPLFNTGNATNVGNMFRGCANVESGALSLYQQMSTQATPPTNHTNTFQNCGADTVTGAAELAQIPTTWGGTMAV